MVGTIAIATTLVACTAPHAASDAANETELATQARWDPSVGAQDCGNAWSAGLSPCDATPDNYVVVHKSARNAALCYEGTLVNNYRVALGFSPDFDASVGDKQQQGDRKTPEGTFYAAELLPSSEYYRAFLLSYPDQAHAERGLESGLITQTQYNRIASAQATCGIPPQSTALGGAVEMHGDGSEADWTWGCVALDDEDIAAIWGVLGLRDTIVVVP